MRQQDITARPCATCGAMFVPLAQAIKQGGGRYCSISCGLKARRRPPIDRFWAKVVQTETCWLWQGDLTPDGYGLFWNGAKMVPVHRFAYEALVGPIPDGMQLDHVRSRGCRHRHCVNPDHLEPVTQQTNILRGDGHAAGNARKTHCKRGHEFTPENTHTQKGGGRCCRACRRLLNAKRMASGYYDRFRSQ